MFSLLPQTRGPRPPQFLTSVVVHACVIGWAIFAPPIGTSTKEATMYRQVFAPNEKKLVWYRFGNKLPDVSPVKPDDSRKKLRAVRKKKDQAIATVKPKNPGDQLTWVPAPELKQEVELKAPNLLAFEAPVIPEPKAPPKPFEPPPPPKAAENDPLPEPAPVTASNPLEGQSPLEERAKPVRQFELPKPKPVEQPLVSLLDAPQLREDVTTANPLLPLPAGPKPRPFKGFDPPPKVVETPVVLAAAAPKIVRQMSPGDALVLPGALPSLPQRPRPKAFVAPSSPSLRVPQSAVVRAGEAPEIAAGGNGATLSAAVVGLTPADSLRPVLPKGSRQADLAAGPELSRDGATGRKVESAAVAMEGLTVQGGLKRQPATPPPDASVLVARVLRADPTSRENLRSAAEPVVDRAAAPLPALPSRPVAKLVNDAPDRRFVGRSVYAMTLQAPNVTSYSGSWMLWFAEYRGRPGMDDGLAAPVPIRKVDPPYAPSAVADRVEGSVRLSAVIRKDGSIDRVIVMQGLDDRLDQSAVNAFSKWLFEPATRNGEPIDVDAVVEIPFRLAPIPKQ